MEIDEDRRVCDMSDDELREAGFLGDDLPDLVKRVVEKAKVSRYLSSCTLFHLRLLKEKADRDALEQAQAQAKPPPEPTPTPDSDVVDVNPNDLLIAPPHLISNFERKHYYHGLSIDPPELYYRSDLESNPYPLPSPSTTQIRLPNKTAEGIYGTKLHTIWDTVGEEIVKELAGNDVKKFMLMPARFCIRYEEEDGRESLGNAVVWIGTAPGSVSAVLAREITPGILRIVEEQGGGDVVVEWYESELDSYY